MQGAGARHDLDSPRVQCALTLLLLSPTMTSLFGATRGAQPPTSSPDELAARVASIKNSIRNEVALQNAQELMNKVSDKCYVKCVPKPGTSLSSSEERCLSQCMDRYLEAFDIISRTYVARLKRERVDPQLS
ncbi:Tim10/DDP family zinc finger-domain-containing protein [Earliella scabrosa]|nr:Tim10/DDP family zinc finger-domain-containing protein [Earliella scabrosa]